MIKKLDQVVVMEDYPCASEFVTGDLVNVLDVHKLCNEVVVVRNGYIAILQLSNVKKKEDFINEF